MVKDDFGALWEFMGAQKSPRGKYEVGKGRGGAGSTTGGRCTP